MYRKTLNEQSYNIAYPAPNSLDNSTIGLQVKVNALRELQSAKGEELSARMPSILEKAFKGKL